MEPKTYRVFRRSCRNWTEFASARKTTIRRGLTYAEAQRMCAEFNNHRTPSQEAKGTKYEFESE